MSSDSDINAVVERWRRNVKGKFRGIASFEERAEMRFNVIKARIHSRHVPADNWQIRYARYHGPNNYEFLDDWRPIKVGEIWGGDDITAFFRQSVTIPPELEGQKVALHIFLGGDSLLRLNGRPHHGMDIFRSEVPITDRATAGEAFDFEIESYMHFQGISPQEHELLASELVAVDVDVRDAYWDLWCAAKMLTVEALDQKLRAFIEAALWKAIRIVPLQETDPAQLKEAILRARGMVRDTIYSTERFKGEGHMYLVGHSHLDVVYMWPYKEFIRKIGRTHATMLRLMDEYPEFKFCQSQAKIYADMETYFPEIFREVKRRFEEGRWELMGAFWVEPDCNLISGESFVRQILHGQKFFRERFGFTSRTCWQPDVFGLSWAMPQILKRSGIDYFVSNKMVPWNDTNPWTLNTFWWEGQDGSRVLGIVPPGHFIGTADPDMIDKQWRAFADKATIGETLHVYGWGDGGGGVDPEMIESGRRYGDFPGLVEMSFSRAEDAFDSIARKAADADLPVLHDEIYLEAHRGTYTHRGRLKKLNRRAELLLREAEMLAAISWAKGFPYPEEQLDRCWKDLLTSQFHDSLPGTHVPPVHVELLADYERLFAAGEEIRSDAAARLIGKGGSQGQAHALLLFNSMLCERVDYATASLELVAGRLVTDAGGSILPQQDIEDLDGARRCIFRIPPAAPVGFLGLGLADAGEVPVGTVSAALGTADHPQSAAVEPAAQPCRPFAVLENEFLRVAFNAAGEITSLYEKGQEREVLTGVEPANRFQMFEDTPGKYDAWDIVETYRDHPVDISGDAVFTIDENGPVRSSFRLEKTLGKSKLVQRIALYAGGREIFFETSIDWVERQRLLKVAFPVDISANFATYDIAYGNMARANHRNTSFDRAKFEVPAHQWMDLSQSDYGVSLMNDCKYGCDTVGRTMRLTLLKGSISPDPRADMEQHFFTYVLYPHPGDWRQADTIGHAASLNNPLLLIPAAPEATAANGGHSFLSCTASNLTLEAVKRSEDGTHLILRLSERHNATTRAELHFPRAVKQAWSCNLMEEIERELPVDGSAVSFAARPHEVVTLRIQLAER